MEALVIEQFLAPLAKHVLTQLAPLAAEEVRLAFTSELKQLQETVTSIEATLLDAEEQQHKNHRLRLCMRKLGEIFRDAEDVLDEFKYEALRKEVRKNPSISRRGRVLNAFSFDSFSPVFSIKTGHKIKDLNQRLEKVSAEWNSFNLGVVSERESRSSVIIRRERETYSSVICSDVIGRDEDREKIVSLLMEPEAEPGNIPVIPVVGIGGLGKTMLTQLVYNDERVVRHFPARIWECVSEDFDLTRLLKAIIRSITRAKVDEDSSLDALQTQLRNLQSSSRFLLVLDDVWNEDRGKWMEFINLLLPLSSLPGSKIIVTTRSLKVGSIMATRIRPYELQGLPHQDCMTLFTRSAFHPGDESRYPNLVKIGEEMVRKCKGVPLAVKTMGSLLFSKTNEREWKAIRDSEIWTLDQDGKGILPVLKFSYNHLPSHLQLCLAFLSLYKKDHNYRSDDIISFWMANGLLENPKPYEEWEDVGSRYLNQLWSRGFIQDVEDEGIHLRFKMHDLIHDLAMNVSQNECKTLSQPESIDETIRHISLCQDGRDSIDFAQVLKNLKRVRTVILQQGGRSTIGSSFVDFCVSNFKLLRMLDLRGSDMEALPESIGKLKHLRHLDMRGCRRIRKLPASLCKLQSLLFLKMTGVPLLELPDSMLSLISLRCLELSIEGSHLITIQPNCWSSLQYLGLFNCDSLQSLFEGMENLKSLRTLHLISCKALKSLPLSLSSLIKLEHLVIRSCLNLNLQMEPASEPEGVDNQNLHFNLKTFSIFLLPASKDLPRLLLERSSSTLQWIKIEECYRFEVLPEWLQDLTSLEKLEIIDCPWLSSLPEGMNRLIALKKLKVKDCPMLSERCRRQEGADWPKIAHVQDVELISS